MMSDRSCRANGMLSHGKIIPANIMVGIVSPIPQISKAVCWVDAIVEISSPSPSDVPTKINDARERMAKLPFIGTLITNLESSRIVM